MKTYFTRGKGERDWKKIYCAAPEEAAEMFAEEWGYDHGNIIEVRNHGKYEITVTPDFHATKARN